MEDREYIIETIYGRVCKSPPIPLDLTLVDGYGNQKAKFKKVDLSYLDTAKVVLTPEDGKGADVVGTYKDRHRTGYFIKEITYTPQQTALIQRELRRIYDEGYFFYVKDVLRWIPGWYYLLLNYWPVSVETPDGRYEYRDEQRRQTFFMWSVYEDKFDLGVLHLKKRRTLGTTLMMVIAFWTATRMQNQQVGLASYDENVAEDNFNILLLDPFLGLEPFLIPTNSASNKSKSIAFDRPYRKKGDAISYNNGRILKSSIKFQALTIRGWDGRKMHFIGDDESGKYKIDVSRRWGKQKTCLVQHSKKIGFAYMPTTLDEVDNGGKGFLRLWNESSEETRQNGKYKHTSSKLIRYFCSAEDGYEGYIDEYGYSIIDRPTDEQWEWMLRYWKESNRGEPPSREWGAAAHLDDELQQLLDHGDEDKIFEHKRQFPRKEEDAFLVSNDKCPFNQTKLEEVKISAGFKPTQGTILRGYPTWHDPIERSTVTFNIGERSEGVWEVSWLPHADLQNLNTKDRFGNMYAANRLVGGIGIDPYAKANMKAKGSDAAIHAKLWFNEKNERENHEYKQVNGGKDMPWYFPTPAYVFRFVGRLGTQEKLFEEILMMAHFYGFPIGIESQAANAFIMYARQRGYGDFLFKKWEFDGRSYSPAGEDEIVGLHMTDDVAQEGATLHNMFLEGRGIYLRGLHYEIEQTPRRYPFVKSIEDNLKFDITDRTKFDSTMSQVVLSIMESRICGFYKPMSTSVRIGIEKKTFENLFGDMGGSTPFDVFFG
jgi:hypothetical protein